MSEQPYRSQPPTAFWSRSVSRDFDPDAVGSTVGPLLRDGDVVVSAGSCFASNIVPWLEAAKITYLRTEAPHPIFESLGENLGYRNFSAAYGNIYTVRQMLQLLRRALGLFKPTEDRWYVNCNVIDPFRPGLRYPASSDAEFDLLTAQHLKATRTAFYSATVLVLTLGLTEAWMSARDGSVYPGAPGTISGTFDPERHIFHNFTAEEVREDLREFIKLVRIVNPAVRVILTVSPVPLVATATDEHVLNASTYSKSVLRVAAGEISRSVGGVTYFPAYEIITGPQAPFDFMEDDRRNVSPAGIRAAMHSLLANSDIADLSLPEGMSPQVVPVRASPPPPGALLSQRVVDAECDELLAES